MQNPELGLLRFLINFCFQANHGADQKLKIKAEPLISGNLFFKDSEGREHLFMPHQEASENIVKKEIFKISDNFRYENCDEFKPKF